MQQIEARKVDVYKRQGDVNAAYSAGAAIASYLKEYGFNLDFAPVADVLTNPDNTVIGDRSFGSDPALVSQMVAAAVRGFQENGVNACIKPVSYTHLSGFLCLPFYRKFPLTCSFPAD